MNERYVNIAKDDSEIYQDKETMEILSDYVILERLNEQDDEIKSLKKDIKILGNHNTEYVRSIYILEDKIKELKEKNATMKGRIINSMIESNKVECSCNPCVCEEYVKKELMR